MQYFLNQGDGSFLEASKEMGVVINQWTVCVGVGDVQQDGFPDIFVTSYGDWSMEHNPPCFQSENASARATCSPRLFEGFRSTLLVSNGDGTYRDASDERGVTERGRSLGVLVADLDDDRDLDCYMANDLQANFIYRNDGKGNFKEIGIRIGAATDGKGSGKVVWELHWGTTTTMQRSTSLLRILQTSYQPSMLG